MVDRNPNVLLSRPSCVPDDDPLLAGLRRAHPQEDALDATISRGRSTFIELSTAARILNVAWPADETTGEGET